MRSDHTEVLRRNLPDLIVLIRRDGVLLSQMGGCDLHELRPPVGCEGQRIDAIWSEALAALIARLMRRALSTRVAIESEFQYEAGKYEARVTASGPNRVICVIRASLAPVSQGEESADRSDLAPHLDRRGFLRRFRESISKASLNERPLAVAIIHLDGLLDISRLLDARVLEQVMGIALRRLPSGPTSGDEQSVPWYIGQMGESILLAVVETSNRERIEGCVARICESLREPIELGDAIFQLTPSVGVAILGQDATSPKALVDHARATAIEARRAGSTRIFFFSDTLKLRSLARLDIARELREAIVRRDIRLRYVGRHDLATGELTAWVGYLQWNHPLRGEVRPAEFVGIAETTGQSSALSRSLLVSLQEDFSLFRDRVPPGVRISFGALRHHVLKDSFAGHIHELIAAGEIAAERLELRISERAYIARDPSVWKDLTRLGVRLVVDEFGRIVSSLELLARAPIWGLQLDRSWVTHLESDSAAMKVCQAAINVAKALNVRAIAAGVDDEARRGTLLTLGCQEGLGDLYTEPGSSLASGEAAAEPTLKARVS